MEPNGLVCRHPKKDGRKRVGGKGVGRERREVVRTKIGVSKENWTTKQDEEKKEKSMEK